MQREMPYYELTTWEKLEFRGRMYGLHGPAPPTAKADGKSQARNFSRHPDQDGNRDRDFHFRAYGGEACRAMGWIGPVKPGSTLSLDKVEPGDPTRRSAS